MQFPLSDKKKSDWKIAKKRSTKVEGWISKITTPYFTYFLESFNEVK